MIVQPEQCAHRTMSPRREKRATDKVADTKQKHQKYVRWEQWEYDILATHIPGNSWKPIEEKLPHRTPESIKWQWRVPMDCFGQKTDKDRANILLKRWSTMEDELLVVTMAQFQRTGKPRRAYWDKVAKTVKRSEQSVRSRYFLLKKRGKFADVENDEFLATGFLPDVPERRGDESDEVDDMVVGNEVLEKAWSEFEQ